MNPPAVRPHLGISLHCGHDFVARNRRRVLELHLSGGSDSGPDWLPSRRVLRLDSHDGAVPEPVWRAFAGTGIRR